MRMKVKVSFGGEEIKQGGGGDLVLGKVEGWLGRGKAGNLLHTATLTHTPGERVHACLIVDGVGG